MLDKQDDCSLLCLGHANNASAAVSPSLISYPLLPPVDLAVHQTKHAAKNVPCTVRTECAARCWKNLVVLKFSKQFRVANSLSQKGTGLGAAWQNSSALCIFSWGHGSPDQQARSRTEYTADLGTRILR